MKNNDQKCFLWCHVWHISLVKIHPERMTRKDKQLANDLDYGGVKFPEQEIYFSKIETKNYICNNVYCYENKLTFPIYISDQKLNRFVVCN